LEILSALDAVMPEDEGNAFVAGKTFILALAERAVRFLEASRLCDTRMRQALTSGRALLSRPGDERVRRQAAIDAARAYLARYPITDVLDEQYWSVHFGGQLAMFAAAPPWPPRREYDPADADHQALRRAVRDAVPPEDLERATSDARRWYCDDPIHSTIGSQSMNAAIAFNDVLRNAPQAGGSKADETAYQHELLLSVLGAAETPTIPLPRRRTQR